MATSSSSAAAAASNPHFSSVSSDAPTVVDGVIVHPHVSALSQVRILSLVDETGSASIGDIIASLPRHEDPVSAIIALVGAGVLELVLHGVLDERTIVRRPNHDPDPDGAGAPVPVAPVLPNLVAAVAPEFGDGPEGVECAGGKPSTTGRKSRDTRG